MDCTGTEASTEKTLSGMAGPAVEACPAETLLKSVWAIVLDREEHGSWSGYIDLRVSDH